MQLTKPVASTGLLIGELASQKSGACYLATVRFSPGFERSRMFFLAKQVGHAKLTSQASGGGVSWLRESFMRSVQGATRDSAGLVAGLSIGDTSLISSSLTADFKVLSLTHLTAVSGTNCAIVLALVWFAPSLLRSKRLVITRWPRFFMASTALIGYVLLVGPQPSVLRAGAMTITVLFAKTLGRASSPMNALVLSCGILLACDPWLFFDYGFVLSILACIGILVVAPKVALVTSRRFQRLPSWLVLAFAASLSAQMLCLPILLILQPGFSTYSILANLLAEPMVLPITVLGLMAVIASAVSPLLASFVSYVASLLAQVIVVIANHMSRWPGATGFWPSGPTGVVLAIVLVFGAVMVAVMKRRFLIAVGATSMAISLCLVASLASSSFIRSAIWARSNWFVVSCDVGQGDATVIRSGSQVALIDVGRETGPINQCLSALGITHINLLILTHFDLDHVGGLAGALAGRVVQQAMLSPFTDTRPGANFSRFQLEQAKVPVVLAQTGLTGKIGGYKWQVLSPHAGAFEAEDSNDGSITMLWRGRHEDIITLADLGEKGQMRLAAESSQWRDQQLSSVPLVMKVSHHGSADQYPELIEALHPTLALVSVGKNNSYGHPTARTLNLLLDSGATTLRTDQRGSIAVARQDGRFTLGFQGEQGKTG